METTVDLANKTVRWSVAGTIIATHIVEALGDQSRTFRPYIEMGDTNDVVELIM